MSQNVAPCAEDQFDEETSVWQVVGAFFGFDRLGMLDVTSVNRTAFSMMHGIFHKPAQGLGSSMAGKGARN